MKEAKAIEKEVELTNVLNLQQDVVVIVSTKESEYIDREDQCQDRDKSIVIEFANTKSSEVFGINL